MLKNTIKVRKVTGRKGMNDFVRFPRVLYAGVSQYVPDLDSDIRDTFNPRKNKSLAFADIDAFVAYRNGEVVGRVAAIISHKANEVWHTKAVRFSLIEFIDDPEVSAALINAVEQWGKERGMTDIQGPMGITDYDKEGMLIEDFELGGSFLEYWNFEYYKDHMARLGFEKEADWLQIRVRVPEEVPARYARVAKYTKEMMGLKVVKKTKKEVMNGYGLRIFDLLNQAYAPLFGFAPFSEEQAKDFLKKFVPLLNMRMVTLVENDKDELVCVAITVADFSDGLRKSRGKIFPRGWYHLLKALKWKTGDKAELMIIGVRPDLQGMGVNALVFDNLIPVYNKLGIRWCETGPQLENNVKELSQWKPMSPDTVKRRRCWTKVIE